jgi:hypothetical protein
MRESRTYGSVRGALSNERPYRVLLQFAHCLLHCMSRLFGTTRTSGNVWFCAALRVTADIKCFRFDARHASFRRRRRRTDARTFMPADSSAFSERINPALKPPAVECYHSLGGLKHAEVG